MTVANGRRLWWREPAMRHEDEDALTGAIVDFVSQFGRYGSYWITAMLKRNGWHVGNDRVGRHLLAS